MSTLSEYMDVKRSGEKTCVVCSRTLPVSRFFKAKSTSDNYMDRCRSCRLKDCKREKNEGIEQ